MIAAGKRSRNGPDRLPVLRIQKPGSSRYRLQCDGNGRFLYLVIPARLSAGDLTVVDGGREMTQTQTGSEHRLARRGTFSEFLTNIDQPMPRREKLSKLSHNLWRRLVLRQACCGHPGEPGC